MTGSSEATGLEAPAGGRIEAAERSSLLQGLSTRALVPGALGSQERDKIPCS